MSPPCALILNAFVSVVHFFTVGDVSIHEMVDPANRTAWITSKVDLAKRQFMDGINIDIEQEVADSSPEYYTLTALVKETTEAFHREIPGSQVSTIVYPSHARPITWGVGDMLACKLITL